MQLVLNVSDDVFKDSIQDQISAIDPKDLQGALLDAIRTYFTENKQAVEKLLFDQDRWSNYREPSAILKTAMASLDYSELQSLADASIELLKSRYESLLRDMLMQQIAEQLTDTYSFRQQLQLAIQQELCTRENSRTV